jgi:hypothetical protein
MGPGIIGEHASSYVSGLNRISGVDIMLTRSYFYAGLMEPDTAYKRLTVYIISFLFLSLFPARRLNS